MKMKYLFSAVMTVFLGVALAPPVLAAELGGYFGVSVGESDADLSVSDFSDGSITSGSVDDTDSATKLYAGYRFTENVAVEGGFFDGGEVTFDGTSVGGFLYVPGPVAWDIETDGLFFAGVFSKNFNKGSVFAKAGFHMWDSEVDIVNAGIVLSGDDDGTDPLFGFGGEYRVNDRIAVRGEYEIFTEILEEDITVLSVGVVISP